MSDLAPSTKAKHWSERLQSFDRRWIFLAMALAIVVPTFFFTLGLPNTVSPPVRSAFYAIEDLKEGDIVWVGLDVDPASTPELEPFFKAVMLQLKRKNVKMVFGTAWYSAPPLIQRWIRENVERPIAAPGVAGYDGPPDRAYEKNKDFVYLGHREGNEAAIKNFGSNLVDTFDGHAADGTPLDQIPVMRGIKQLKDFKLLVLISAGFPGAKEYVQYVQGPYKLKIVAACTAVSTTDLAPYLQSGQLLGLSGGLKASTEYESLVGKKSRTGAQAVDVLNVASLVVILAIIFGNLIYFVGRARRTS